MTVIKTMSTKRRSLSVLLVFAIQMLYTPLNYFLRGGIAPVISLDSHFPLWTIWVVPYSLATVWWLVAYAWAAWKMDDHLLRVFIMGGIFILLISQAFFITLPTYVIRPQITGSSVFDFWLRQVYLNDKPYNAFPSLHVSFTMFISMVWGTWFPRWRWFFALVLALVMFSTIFTHQHYWLDIVGGTLMGAAGIWVGFWAARRVEASHV